MDAAIAGIAVVLAWLAGAVYARWRRTRRAVERWNGRHGH